MPEISGHACRHNHRNEARVLQVSSTPRAVSVRNQNSTFSRISSRRLSDQDAYCGIMNLLLSKQGSCDHEFKRNCDCACTMYWAPDYKRTTWNKTPRIERIERIELLFPPFLMFASSRKALTDSEMHKETHALHWANHNESAFICSKNVLSSIKYRLRNGLVRTKRKNDDVFDKRQKQNNK
jgi:hypothetical protein